MKPEEIKTLRSAMGLSQESFAARVGVTFMTVHRWETGKTKPHKTFVKTMKRLGNKEVKAND